MGQKCISCTLLAELTDFSCCSAVSSVARGGSGALGLLMIGTTMKAAVDLFEFIS